MTTDSCKAAGGVALLGLGEAFRRLALFMGEKEKNVHSSAKSADSEGRAAVEASISLSISGLAAAILLGGALPAIAGGALIGSASAGLAGYPAYASLSSIAGASAVFARYARTFSRF